MTAALASLAAVLGL